MRRMLIGLSALLWGVLVLAAPVAWAQQPPTAPAPPPPGTAPPKGPRVVNNAQFETFVTLVNLPAFSSPELDKQAAGLPADSRPELLTWELVYTLALVRARTDHAAAAPSLDPQELAAAANRLGVADFARFRKEFLSPRPENAAFTIDPAAKFLSVLARLLAIDNARRSVTFYENVKKLFQELVQGESLGLSRIDLDLVHSVYVRARQTLNHEIGQFRDELDELKVAIGLSPRVPVLPDRKSLAAFASVFDSVEEWQRQPNRHLGELYQCFARLPAPDDVVVDGRRLSNVSDAHPGGIEASLMTVVQSALRNRPTDAKGPAAPGAETERELQIRKQFRHLFQTRWDYDDEKWAIESSVRLKDQAFERFVAPRVPQAAPRTPFVAAFLQHVVEVEKSKDHLVAIWVQFRLERLAFYRELGALPYDDWNAFYEQFHATLEKPAESQR
jgi:hypothetical protein